MKILVLAPHPFFQNRGTPIDVLLVLRVLSERENTQIELLTYNEGTDVHLHNLTIHRIPNFVFAKNIRPGFSFKKLICDFFLFVKAWSLVRRNKYDLVHAGEESVFMAMFFKYRYKIPYAYDLDSSIAQQLVEKKPVLRILSPFFNWMESQAIRRSLANAPVCNALAELCNKNHSSKTVTLHDVSQLKNPYAPNTGRLKKDLRIQGLILLYCGNLEPYQGIDLLLDSFQLACEKTNKVDLVIIGGVEEDIKHYKEKSRLLSIDKKTHFLGPKPFEQLDQFLAEADILVAPRVRGINTPMKIFPFMHSGKPVLLTDLYTHNQIITDKEAYLAPANPSGFAKGILDLAGDNELRKQLGQTGREYVERNHTYSAHKKRLNDLYDWIEEQISENTRAFT